MPERTAAARWNGALRDGSGRVKLGSGDFEGAYSWSSRFENGTGTNPEELVAAAHAGRFTTATASALGKEGLKPESITTKATVHFDSVSGSFRITRIDLDTEAVVPGIEEAKFLEIVEGAKKNCPISKH